MKLPVSIRSIRERHGSAISVQSARRTVCLAKTGTSRIRTRTLPGSEVRVYRSVPATTGDDPAVRSRRRPTSDDSESVDPGENTDDQGLRAIEPGTDPVATLHVVLRSLLDLQDRRPDRTELAPVLPASRTRRRRRGTSRRGRRSRRRGFGPAIDATTSPVTTRFHGSRGSKRSSRGRTTERCWQPTLN